MRRVNAAAIETTPLITQEGLAKDHTEKIKLSFLLFDEIEKASDALWQADAGDALIRLH
jgi:hypothetical protein